MDSMLADWPMSNSDLPSCTSTTLGGMPERQLEQEGPPRSQMERSTYRSRKKLRESCNNCAISKVKCTKEHPQCQRCEDREMQCHYSPTRRTGKRRAWSQTLPAPNKVIDTPTLANASMHSPPGGKGYSDYQNLVFDHSFGLGVHFSSELESSLVEKSGAFDGNLQVDLFQDTLDPGLFNHPNPSDPRVALEMVPSNSMHLVVDPKYEDQYQSLVFNLSPPVSREHDMSSHPGASIFDHTTDIHGAAVGNYYSTLQNRHSFDDNKKESLADEQSLHCLGRCLEILRMLHDPPTNCARTSSVASSSSSSLAMEATSSLLATVETSEELPTSRSAKTPATPATPEKPPSAASQPSQTKSGFPRTIEQVLAINKQTLAAVEGMLGCPCSLNIQVALLMTTIVSKILCWYGAAARAVPDEPQDKTRNCSATPTAGRGTSNMSMSLVTSPMPNSGVGRRSSPLLDSTPDAVSVSAMSAVGRYPLNNEHGPKMYAQLVLSELHLVLRLVKKIVARFRDVREDGVEAIGGNDRVADSLTGVPRGSGAGKPPTAGPTNQTANPATPVLIQMEQFLQNQLRAIARDTTQMLISS
ncbi:uncharacterized protein E0L32_011527 [Thyridium curvatum]|uniref:Zn(2)-C6 fungal-type domain-containing protein n=1 Tax=Thyridium curvatum TaxID=1093900 RepID=A0A507BPP0_9PEZI|nr:uncharacterized protein E0L32_011527 [Thyridium curvatum]TPX18778.1 hypothetical protein E0L32_011527 [Thyridium curvatum]